MSSVSTTIASDKRWRNFGGVRRRFTRTGAWNGVTIIDDYGHHPVEIAAVLKAARELTKGQVIAVVQPHRYTRLAALFEQFCTCFNDADAVIVAHVYPAGEAPIEGADRDASGAGIAHPRPSPRGRARQSGKACSAGRRNGAAGRLCRLPRRRLDHAMGLCAARRIGGGGLDHAAEKAWPGIDPEREGGFCNGPRPAERSGHDQKMPGHSSRRFRGSRTFGAAGFVAGLWRPLSRCRRAADRRGNAARARIVDRARRSDRRL